MKNKSNFISCLIACLGFCTHVQAGEVLVEAESFTVSGGWVLDPQFVDLMGSPYLLAHGLGKPVQNAKTEVTFPEAGTYHLWVRTKDWIPEPEWAPGKFQVVVDGKALATEFGVTGDGQWVWQAGNSVEITNKTVTLELQDLTGFEGRCDALLFSTDKNFVPPAKAGKEMRDWRKKLLGLPADAPSAGTFDVVIVGGGIAGCSAAITAARLGCRVALVQNRPVFGGNSSPEIGVRGAIWGKPGPFVTREIYGQKSTADLQKGLDQETNIQQFRGWHVFAAHTREGRILTVDALDIASNKELRFEAPVFIDCTGDGWLGFYAGADFRYGSEGRSDNNEPLAPEKPDKTVLGATLHWDAKPGDKTTTFPEVPWATAISKDKAATAGYWTWEYGHQRDMIAEAEEIRDYLFRSIYGSFATAKRVGVPKKLTPEEMSTYALTHVNYILGKRESRRLLGDYVMTQLDFWETPTKDDKVAISNNPFDIHTPTEKYDFNIHVDERYGGLNKRQDCDIPFRTLYSRNVSNLLMAGRCISATHIAHSSVRVMNTGSQTGVAAGAAAYLCKRYQTTPREVGQKHISELQDIVFGKGNYADTLKPKKKD
jgi:FAD dependent oxidoreductase